MRGRMPEWARVTRPALPWRDRRKVAVDGLLWVGGSVPVVIGQVVPDDMDALW